jgi:uncharacterized hydrophobic protein (TIGR00271 family)
VEFIRNTRSFLWDRLDLSQDQADSEAIDAAVRNGVPFRGTNLWVLIFAIFVASVGLNVNSTAVIIGAMLISPLMGPIVGVGYGAGIHDGQLVRQALFNLAIAAGISLMTSSLYFAMTPLAGAQSELLARTSPSLWDVLIALFGGLAGIVGITRKEKSNVLPGVAIATALMPPLCTAGYGIANLDPTFFFGAFYLFAINSVFIAAATWVMVRFMKLPVRTFVDPKVARRAQTWGTLAVVVTMLPSLWLAFGLVRTEVFNARADRFLQDAFPADRGSLVVAKEADFRTQTIRVTLVGQPVDDTLRETLIRTLPAYNLPGVSLQITQNEQVTVDVAGLRADLARDVVGSTLATLEKRDAEIAALKVELAKERGDQGRFDRLDDEILVQLPSPATITVAPMRDKGALVVLDVAEPLPAEVISRLQAWLDVRLGGPCRVVQVAPPSPPDARTPARRGGPRPAQANPAP